MSVRSKRAGRAQPQVVAVHRDVKGADRHLAALDGGDPLGEPAGQGDAARGDAEQDEVRAGLGALEDLVRDARQRALDIGGVQNGLAVRAGGRCDT